jgi:NAD(P)-dependent dehydrogenase (short-subunit alcohol dehydrogenase family)
MNSSEKKICLITGATAGIGLETAKGIANKNIHVVLVGRSKGKCEQAIQYIKATNAGASLNYLICDLSSQKSVRQLAKDFLETYNRLNILINNAGAVFSELQYSEDEIEMQFAVNHLAPFLLTNLLLDILKESAPARIVNVSSHSHYRGKINFDDLYHTEKYWAMTVYEQSKLANVLFTYELDRMLEDTGVTVNALHPGVVDTTIGNTNSKGVVSFAWRVIRLFGMSAADGAKTSIYLATSEEVATTSGKYFNKCKPKKSSRASFDKEAALKLWQISETLTKLKS